MMSTRLLRKVTTCNRSNFYLTFMFIEQPVFIQICSSFVDAKLRYRTMMKVFTVLKIQTDEVQQLRHLLERSSKPFGDGITSNVFAERYNFSKILSVDDFRTFDSRLKDDEKCRTDFVSFYLKTVFQLEFKTKKRWFQFKIQMWKNFEVSKWILSWQTEM